MMASILRVRVQTKRVGVEGSGARLRWLQSRCNLRLVAVECGSVWFFVSSGDDMSIVENFTRAALSAVHPTWKLVKV